MLPRCTPFVCVHACIVESSNTSAHLCCALVVHVVATHRKSATLLGVQFELYFCQSTERRELPLHHRSLIVICRRLVKRCRNISRLVLLYIYIYISNIRPVYNNIARYRESGKSSRRRSLFVVPPPVTNRVTHYLSVSVLTTQPPGISGSNWTLNSFYFRPNESGEKGLKRFIIRESCRGQTLLPQSGAKVSQPRRLILSRSFPSSFLPPPFRP